MRQSRNIRCDLDVSAIEKVSLSNMSLYPKYGVYKIVLEISGLKKSVVISDLSLKPMSLNPKFTVHNLIGCCRHAAPLSYSHCIRVLWEMNAYLQQDFPVQFNVSSSANNNKNISMLEYSLSCCGVMKYTEYVNNNKTIPTTCECIKSKPNCNKTLSIYGDGCKTRLERTNQMQAC